MDYPKTIGWLPAIALLPLLGALVNACLGKRLGKAFVSVVGVAAPAVAFTISMAFFGAMQVDDRAVIIRGGRNDLMNTVQPHLLSKGLAVEVEDNGRDTSFVRGSVQLRVHGARVDDDVFREVAGMANLSQLPAVAGSVPGGQRSFKADLGSWISVGKFEARFGFLLDRLSIILVLVITGVGTLIHIYSTAYMEHEDAGGFARYFTYLNLFVGSMLVLVLAADLFVLFIGWEGVGLCSYLLIGFHYKDPANAACGTKAFVVNRIGDLGFILGVLTLLVAVRAAAQGDLFGADIGVLNDMARTGRLDATTLGIACALLFLGCTGKSAQIPLHLWLPDAMAGPTPVSALIHAATMVTAGVYLIARLSPCFAGGVLPLGDAEVPVLGIVAVVGVLTAFFAGTAALGQDDIKRVLAYSTVSQLGYMFVGVGAGAYGAAVFHLVTHAFFKALLFLGAGAVIHATHTQSLREMGGLRRYMPTTFLTMCVGALGLAAIVPFSGFFSKDMILFHALARADVPNASAGWWHLVYGLGVVTGGITALYSARLICLTFFGDYRGRGEPHEAPSAMTAPLVVLAVLAIAGGALGLPAVAGDRFAGIPVDILPHYLGGIVASSPAMTSVAPDHLHHLELGGLLAGIVVGLVGFGVGWAVWNRPPSQVPWEAPTPGGLLERTRGVLANAWYYDEAVNKKGIQPATKSFAEVLWRWVDDAAIDRGLVDGSGAVGQDLSTFARGFQTGHVARYAGYFVIGVVVIPLLTLGGLPLYRAILHMLAGHGSGGGH